MPAIQSAMKELRLQPRDISLVIVSIGPGGFTGLRISTTIAKMISFATGATIVPVQSAVVVAAASSSGPGPFLIVSSVKKEEFWLSRVEQVNNTWQCTASLSNKNNLPKVIDGVTRVFADDFLPLNARQYFEELGIPITGVDLDAETLLQIGVQLHGEGEKISAVELQPLYPREPEAVRIWKTR
jgi:tRNA threonylcarbamoyladenosine biosynthesis protein TsaB